jgi:hypothetical protein
MGSVFISYRRQTAAGEARALFNDLAARLGPSGVFMDVDSISLGRDFRTEIHKTLAVCDLVLVLIDKEWAAVKDEKGQIRLANPGDYVRMEIEAALKRDIAVTPVLVKGAQMPAAKDLPAEISDLVYRSGFELSHGLWESDVREMIRRLNLAAPERDGQAETDRSAALQKRPTVPGARWLIGIPVAIAAALAIGYLALTQLPHPGAESPVCDLTGDWTVRGERYSLKQTGTSVAFRYETPTVDHKGSGLYDKDGRRIILNLTRELKSNGCKLSGTSTIEIVTCRQLQSKTTWDAGCDLPQGVSDLSMSERAP